MLPLLLGLALAAEDPVSRLLDAPTPPGASLRLTVESVGAPAMSADLDLRREADQLALRLDVLDGDRAGQRVLALRNVSGQGDRSWSYKPALGVAPSRTDAMEKRFQEVGLSLEDLVDVLLPQRMGPREGWSVDGATVLAPPDASGCRDRVHLDPVGQPQRLELCANTVWGAREVRVLSTTPIEGVAVPDRIEVHHADGRVVKVGFTLAEAARWKDAARFTQDALDD